MRTNLLLVLAATSSFGLAGESQAAPAKAVPVYNIAAYCSQVANSVGGSYVIEKGCREQERQAMVHAANRAAPARARNYCDEVARAVGGSYVIYDGCIDQDLSAAASM